MEKYQYDKAILQNMESSPVHFDPLTGLPNMGYFFELTKAAKPRLLQQGKKPTLLYFDLSGMKFYNSEYGFAEGDKLLTAFGQILVRYFGHEACSRFAQDHFAAFTGEEKLEEMLQAIFEESKGINHGHSLPVRVGIYEDHMESVSPETACDRAMYACDVNRGTFVSAFYYFDEKMLAEAKNRQYIIKNLDRALEEKWIKVYYQAIVRAANGRVCDEEALARWIDPQKGFISPGEFIPVMESAKLIHKLDLYVLDQILQKIKDESEMGLYIVPHSLNLSRADFDACDIVEEICRRVDASGIPREKLTIEITEGTVGGDFDFMKKQIRLFQDLGFKVWMDDFGSGYSSLDVLQSIRFDLIKFDMRFLQNFDKKEESKIILAELIKMVSALGIDMVAEGVETKEQADFLKEVGCTKLQGFYYTKAIPLDVIADRHKNGTQIGYENPDESEYFAAVGRINVYDQASVANEGNDDYKHYFDSLPMAIMEFDDERVTIVRSNKAYRDLLEQSFSNLPLNEKFSFSLLQSETNLQFVDAIKQCRENGKRVFVTVENPGGLTTYSLLRYVAVNPVTGITACAELVVDMTDNSKRGVTYTHVAQALSADYINLYYVNLETEQFTEYNSAHLLDRLDVERRGNDFFNTSRKDALDYIYEADRDYFISNFTKEKVLRAIELRGAFTLSYRLLINGEPIYVNMKAVRMGDNHIIIGVNNVDDHMKQKEKLERLQAEQVIYNRITALAGDYLCIYTVDPDTDHYIEYAGSEHFEKFGLAKTGEEFFERVRTESENRVYKDDLPLVWSAFTKENVLREIRENGMFVLQYRLLIDGKPMYINARAVLLEEKDGPKLIIGLNNIDVQMKDKLKTEMQK